MTPASKRAHLTCGLLACAAMFAGCLGGGSTPMGIPLRTTTRFEGEWRRYLDLPEYKALAVSGNVEEVYVSGAASGHGNQRHANEEALDLCEQRRADRRIEAPCRFYAIGDERVQPDDPGWQ